VKSLCSGIFYSKKIDPGTEKLLPEKARGSFVQRQRRSRRAALASVFPYKSSPLGLSPLPCVLGSGRRTGHSSAMAASKTLLTCQWLNYCRWTPRPRFGRTSGDARAPLPPRLPARSWAERRAESGPRQGGRRAASRGERGTSAAAGRRIRDHTAIGDPGRPDLRVGLVLAAPKDQRELAGVVRVRQLVGQ
jgi:hypothetical protein